MSVLWEQLAGACTERRGDNLRLFRDRGLSLNQGSKTADQRRAFVTGLFIVVQIMLHGTIPSGFSPIQLLWAFSGANPSAITEVVLGTFFPTFIEALRALDRSVQRPGDPVPRAIEALWASFVEDNPMPVRPSFLLLSSTKQDLTSAFCHSWTSWISRGVKFETPWFSQYSTAQS